MDSTNKDLSRSLNKPNNIQLRLCQDRICLECGDDHSIRIGKGDFLKYSVDNDRLIVENVKLNDQQGIDK